LLGDLYKEDSQSEDGGLHKNNDEIPEEDEF